MVERSDPGRAGVKAGRIVGLLTALLAVASLLRVQDSFYEGMALILGAFGVDSGAWLAVVFWGNVLFAASARYVVGYVVGSLVGVLYDWLECPSLSVLVVIVFVVGVVDGVLAFLDTLSVPIAGAYVLAWLCYVPAFLWLFDDEGEPEPGPRRLGES